MGDIGHRSRMSITSTRRASTAEATTTAVAATLALIALTIVALRTARGQRWDDWSMNTVVAGRDTRVAILSVLGYVSIGAIIAVVAGCAVVALLRGRVQLAVGAVIVVAGANLTTQVLKHTVLDRPDLGFGTLNSLPSGHTTVVASCVGAALLVAPRLGRVVIVLAGGFATTLTAASTIVAGWHRPADVLAALAVCLMWTAAVAAFLPGDRQLVRGTAVVAVIGCAGALAFLVLVGVRPLFGWDGFVQAGLVLGGVTAATALFVVLAAAVSPAE